MEGSEIKCPRSGGPGRYTPDRGWIFIWKADQGALASQTHKHTDVPLGQSRAVELINSGMSTVK